MTRAEAQHRLGPFVPPVFVEPTLAAVADWHRFVQELPDIAMAMDATAKANMIHCVIRRGARAALVGQSGIREITALGFFAVATETTPLVRFKLLHAGAASNVATDRQDLLAKQQYDEDDMAALALEGIPDPPTALTCGYELDIADQVSSIEIRCHYDRQLVWRWPIWGAEAAGGGGVENLPLPDFPSPVPARVQSRRKARAKERQEAP